MSPFLKKQWLILGGGVFGTGLMGVCVLLASAPAASAPPVTTPGTGRMEAVAVVNGREVSGQRFERLIAARRTKARLSNGLIPEPIDRALRIDTAEQLIDEHLLEEAASDLGLMVQEEDVDRGLEAFKRSFDTEADFNRFVDEAPLGLSELRRRMHSRLLQERVAEIEAGPVSDETVKAFFESQPERFAPTDPSQPLPSYLEVEAAVRAECLSFMRRRQQAALMQMLRARAHISSPLLDSLGARSENESALRGEWKKSSTLVGEAQPSPSQRQESTLSGTKTRDL
ncbi:SurA N-terminal domain-containing protein [Corallococcus terminator]|nr:SurA N-terminal domain-containing protein [Corallococcus terminator]